jgi:hypothetical protein
VSSDVPDFAAQVGQIGIDVVASNRDPGDLARVVMRQPIEAIDQHRRRHFSRFERLQVVRVTADQIAALPRLAVRDRGQQVLGRQQNIVGMDFPGPRPFLIRHHAQAVRDQGGDHEEGEADDGRRPRARAARRGSSPDRLRSQKRAPVPTEASE